MSIEISDINQKGVDIKTHGIIFPGQTEETVRFGQYEVPLSEFLLAVEYVMTNTDLNSDDPRILLALKIKHGGIVPGFNTLIGNRNTKRIVLAEQLPVAIDEQPKVLVNDLQNEEVEKEGDELKATTIEGAVDELYSKWKDNVDFIEDINQNIDADSWASSIHHSMGRAIRNGYKLWSENTPVRDEFRNSLSMSHPDDMSHYILKKIFEKAKSTK